MCVCELLLSQELYVVTLYVATVVGAVAVATVVVWSHVYFLMHYVDMWSGH